MTRSDQQTDTSLVTVMYHYVRDVERTPFPEIKGVSIDEFKRQVDLVKSTFATPPLEGCLEFLSGQWSPDRDLCILTFDDGLAEHHDIVVEILLDAAVPAAFFLPTAAIEDHDVLAVHMNHFLLASLGTPALREHIEGAANALGIDLPPRPSPDDVAAVYRWDDAETASLKYLVNHQLSADVSESLLSFVFPQVLGPPAEFAAELYLSWDEAREMQAAGFSVGGHTHRHKVLSSMTADAQQDDLAQSTQLLRSNLGEGTRGFAYPYGKPSTYTDDTIAHLESLEYVCAFNTEVDHARPGTSRWEIPRIDPKDL